MPRSANSASGIVCTSAERTMILFLASPVSVMIESIRAFGLMNQAGWSRGTLTR